VRSEEVLRTFGVRSDEVFRNEAFRAFSTIVAKKNNIGTIAASDGFFDSISLQ
jgi:hypothetical protein